MMRGHPAEQFKDISYTWLGETKLLATFLLPIPEDSPAVFVVVVILSLRAMPTLPPAPAFCFVDTNFSLQLQTLQLHLRVCFFFFHLGNTVQL